MHVHTADYHCVVLEGTMQHWEQGQSQTQAKLLNPGSFWFQPGNAAHSDACLSEQCLMYVQWAGPRDARLAEPAKN
jgi:quercetin dioxygenase-like cupin family protein